MLVPFVSVDVFSACSPFLPTFFYVFIFENSENSESSMVVLPAFDIRPLHILRLG